ncbi:hypothetical protein GCM10010121_025810 [Streptomyces brasiliensis]|uniref:Uncharacterized protein n=1 Tax=Streptomyces brasiliensis TaxID=1954 RepID=A0A917KIZ1_9ACTN|nr:hypothetical protein GCM10010121_025810 [Streptomyces brasiliensis]
MRRMGSTPAERGSATGQSCPDPIEADDGDFLVIGKFAQLSFRDGTASRRRRGRLLGGRLLPPPGVPRQESCRALRAGRERRLLPDRRAASARRWIDGYK